MKFGQLFDLMGQGFSSIIKTSGKSSVTNKASTPEGAALNFDKATKNLEELEVTANTITERIVKAQKKLDDVRRKEPENLEKIEALEKNLDKQRAKALIINKQIESQEKATEKANEKLIKSFDNYQSKFSKIDVAEKAAKDLSLQIDKLKDELDFGAISGAEFEDKMKSLLDKGFAMDNLKTFQGGINNVQNALKDNFMTSFENSIITAGVEAGYTAEELMLVKVAFDILKDVAEMVWKQITELNSVLIEMTRNSSGLFNAFMINSDAMGNMTGSAESLKTQLLMSNLSMEDFSKAMGGLFTDGFGQIAGMKTNLKEAGDEMLYFGKEAAKYSKLWGVNLSEAVRELTMNYNTGLKESTLLATETADAAKDAGLSMEAAVKNLQQVAALAGSYYFTQLQGMKNLALYATLLGSNVNTLMGSIGGLESVTDLFTKQQSFAALELGNTANNMAKIYALKQTGQGDKAIGIMVGNLAKDLKAKGMMGEHGVTNAGIATLKGAGIDQEAIQAVSRLGKMSEETGIALEKLMSPEKANFFQKLQIKNEEVKNRTILESLSMLSGSLRSTIVDPLAKVFGPLIKAFIDITSAIWSFVKPILDFAISIAFIITGLDFLIGVITGVGETFTYVFGALSSIWDSISSYIMPVVEVVSSTLQTLGEYLGYVIGIIAIAYLPSLTAMAFAALANVIPLGLLAAEALAAGFALLTISWPVIAVVAAIALLGYVIYEFKDVIWDIIKIAFLPLIAVGYLVYKSFELLWKGISWVADKIGDWFSDMWKDISNWFSNIWQNTASWFSNIWQNTSNWFSNIFNKVGSTILDFINYFLPINDILGWFSNGLDELIDGFNSLVKYLNFFDSEPAKKDISANSWDEMFGVASNASPVTPEANIKGDKGEYSMALSSVKDIVPTRATGERSDQNARGTSASVANNNTNNNNNTVIVNSSSDPLFGGGKISVQQK